MKLVFAPPGAVVGDRALAWVGPVPAPAQAETGSATELNLRLNITALPENRDFVIEITNASGTLFQKIRGDSLTMGEKFWTLSLPTTFAEVSVYGAAALDGLGFEIDRIAYTLPGGALESIFGNNELIGVDNYDGDHANVVASVESAVGRLTFFVDDSARDYCTAFRIGPNLLQTSRHCIPDEATCDDAKILFGYKKNAFNATLRGQEVNCAEVVAADDENAADTVLLRVEPTPDNDYATVAFRDSDASVGEPLFIVQHPGGETKQVSIVNCGREDDVFTKAEQNAFGHTCDTKGGSSGSPVFSLDGLVVGQQRAGHGNPDLTDKLNLATFGTLLGGVDAPEVAEPVSSTATTTNHGTSTDNATPLPLPSASEGAATNESDRNAGGPTIMSPGSGGGGVAPDTSN
ncbi:trypsin-like serine peptidase [Roseibium sp.]|uniref:trypsin-like serine peptidase n=1 Tax=Roseibium sp. TaxID=1936156 RepID=UPI003A96D592